MNTERINPFFILFEQAPKASKLAKEQENELTKVRCMLRKDNNNSEKEEEGQTVERNMQRH